MPLYSSLPTWWPCHTRPGTASGSGKRVSMNWSTPQLSGSIQDLLCTGRTTFLLALHRKAYVLGWSACVSMFSRLRYDMLDDIGHEAIDTHKASPTVRHNHISCARTGGINFHTGTPVIFENNRVQDCRIMIQLQGNAWPRIQGNAFQESENTDEPWIYGDFTLTSESPSSGVGLSDNVEVEIVWNRFGGIPGPLLF